MKKHISILATSFLLTLPLAGTALACDYADTSCNYGGGDDGGDSGGGDDGGYNVDLGKYHIDTPDAVGNNYVGEIDFHVIQHFNGIGVAAADGDETQTVAFIERNFISEAGGLVGPDGAGMSLAMFSTTKQLTGARATGTDLAAVQASNASEDVGWGGVVVKDGAGLLCGGTCPQGD